MHDAAYKTLFSHPRVVRDLLRGFVPEPWTDALDLDSLEKLPAEFTSDDLRRQRRADAVWRIRFRGEWLYVLVLLEFQSTEDRYMALRILVYTGLLHQDLIRRGATGPHGVLPPVLPIVLYNGTPARKAEAEVSRLIAPVHEDVECVFRSKPITQSSANRSLIPFQADHPFQSMPITDSSSMPITFWLATGTVRGV